MRQFIRPDLLAGHNIKLQTSSIASFLAEHGHGLHIQDCSSSFALLGGQILPIRVSRCRRLLFRPWSFRHHEYCAQEILRLCSSDLSFDLRQAFLAQGRHFGQGGSIANANKRWGTSNHRRPPPRPWGQELAKIRRKIARFSEKHFGAYVPN